MNELTEQPDDETKTLEGEVRDPSYRTLVDWIVDWIVTTNPPYGSTVPKADVVALTGLEWETRELRLNVLVPAKDRLIRSTRFEWSITDEGLQILTPAERVAELERRRRESMNRQRTIIASSATIPRDQLSVQQRAEADHAARVAVHMIEEQKRASRKKWLPMSEPKKIEDGGKSD